MGVYRYIQIVICGNAEIHKPSGTTGPSLLYLSQDLCIYTLLLMAVYLYYGRFNTVNQG